MSHVIVFDLETSLIRPGCSFPPVSCMSYQMSANASTSLAPKLLAFADGGILPLVKQWLSDDGAILVGHNVAFDLFCLCAEWPELIPLVFAKYEADLVTDTMLRQKLLDIASGCYRGEQGPDGWVKHQYSLVYTAKRMAGVPIKKEGFRFFYAPFRNVPLVDWVEFARHLQARAVAYKAGQADAELAYLRACLDDDKKFFTELDGMIAADPREVIRYPLDDATAPTAVYWEQEELADPYLLNQWKQARDHAWLALASAHGMRTSPARVGALQVQTQHALRAVEKRLQEAGLVRANGTRDTAAAKQRMLDVCGWRWDDETQQYVPTTSVETTEVIEDWDEGTKEILVRHVPKARLPLRLTAAGQPQLDADACKATEDSLLIDYATLTQLGAVLSKDTPALARASVFPIHTHFDLAETGRATSSNPNIQNWRRLIGIRECFTPRPGHVYIQADYSGLESCTLAQVCLDLFGRSRLAEVINSGRDVHTAMGCQILGGLDYDDVAARIKAGDKVAKNARQLAKIPNFGFPGGLGAKRLVAFARKSGVEISEEQAKELKRQWFLAWPEMREYFRHIESLVGADGLVTLEQLRSKRIRGGASYTAACNSYFQGLGADATKHAGWLIARACYVDRSSPLFGCRVVNYVHDEFIAEAPEERAAEAAEELSRLMVRGASEWIPDIQLAAVPCIMRVWSKDAETLRDDNGRLIPWAPEEKVAA